MSSAGQIVGGIAGGVIGFFATGGNPYGAFQGAVLGAGIGGYIDPPPGPNLHGPTLSDKSFQSSSYGVSIPRLYGTIATMGNIIYLENNEYKSVSQKEDQGGKGGGGGGTLTTTTYYATFAIALGSVMPGSGIRRMWAGGKLFASYDTGDLATMIQTQGNSLGWRYYDGTQTEPDSRMESVLGVGNCPSYEGLAYIIFYDFELTEYGNGLAGCPIKVEIVTSNTSDESEGGELILIGESAQAYPATMPDPVDGASVVNLAHVSSVGVDGKYATFYTKYYTAYPDLSEEMFAGIYQFSAPEFWSFSKSGPYDPENHYIVPGINDSRIATYIIDLLPINVDLGGGPEDEPDGIPDYTTQYQSIGGGSAAVQEGDSPYAGLLMAENNNTELPYSGVAIRQGGGAYVINDTYIRLIEGGATILQRSTNSPTGVVYKLYHADGFLYRADQSPGGLNVHVYADDTLELLRTVFIECDDLGYEWFFSVYQNILWLAMCRHTTFDSPKTEMCVKSFLMTWLDGYNPIYQIPLVDIVSDLCASAGLAADDLDLSDFEITDVVDGYRCDLNGSVRADLAPLQVAYKFDWIDAGYKLKAKKRGSVSVNQIKFNNFLGQPKTENIDKLMLPIKYELSYLSYNREYDVANECADYPGYGKSIRRESLPVVMTSDSAAQLADILINSSHMESKNLQGVLPQVYLGLRCGDVVNMEYADGFFSDFRIESLSVGVDQALEITAKSTNFLSYQSNASGAEIQPPSETVPLVSNVYPILIDCPMISDDLNTYGIGCAVFPEAGANFKGAQLQNSSDGGQSYKPLSVFYGYGTLGRAINVSNISKCDVIDRNTVLTVSVVMGNFYSITEELMLTGKNYFAYGQDGRWEVCAYSYADVVGERLIEISNLLRGLHGTEWAATMHESSDYIILLGDLDNQFINLNAAAIGVPYKYRSVAFGGSVDQAVVSDFIYRAVNLTPLSPVHIRGNRVGSDWAISWEPRTRFSSSQWVTGVAAPIGEAQLLFDVEIYDEDDLLIGAHQVSLAEFNYTEAMQISDSGAAMYSFTVRIYQISAAVGRGRYASASVEDAGLDPLWSDVLLLLNFNGADASTTFTDSSDYSRTPVAVGGDAKLSTSSPLFGSACGVFDGTGDYLQYGQLLFGNSDFTIDAAVYITSYPKLMFVFGQETISGFGRFDFLVAADGRINLYVHAPGGGNIYSANIVPVNQWVKLRLVRASDIWYGFINGNLEFTWSLNQSLEAHDFWVARQPLETSRDFVGKIDELRVTGAARSTASYSIESNEYGQFNQ